MEDITDNVTDFEHLYQSLEKCKRGVMWKTSVAHFELNGIEEVLKLEKELKDGSYKPRPTVNFEVTAPKKREITSVAFRDRVYQRSLNDNALYPQMTKSFIYDNGACQKGKGTDFSRGRLTCFLQRYYRKHGARGWVLQCDIKGYYPNMSHDIAEKTFREHLTEDAYDRAEAVLRGQYEGDVGYSPGSQMIQIAGISVLNVIDHYAKEKMHAKYYLRYMDDFIFISNDRAYLERCYREISNELAKIGFKLNEKKTKIYPIDCGITFLGFVFRLTDTGKVIKIISPENVKRERKKLYRLVQKAKRGDITRKKVDECYNSWKAHALKGNSWKLIKKMDEYYNSLW